MLATNATKLGIVPNQVSELRPLLHEIRSRKPFDLLLEVTHAKQIRQHSTGVIEAQRLIEIRSEQVMCLMRARFHLCLHSLRHRVTTDTDIRYQAWTIESVKSHARKLRKLRLLQSGAYLTHPTACMRIVGASHCALRSEERRVGKQGIPCCTTCSKKTQ